jgi:hypothetical protein
LPARVRRIQSFISSNKNVSYAESTFLGLPKDHAHQCNDITKFGLEFEACLNVAGARFSGAHLHSEISFVLVYRADGCNQFGCRVGLQAISAKATAKKLLDFPSANSDARPVAACSNDPLPFVINVAQNCSAQATAFTIRLCVRGLAWNHGTPRWFSGGGPPRWLR